MSDIQHKGLLKKKHNLQNSQSHRPVGGITNQFQVSHTISIPPGIEEAARLQNWEWNVGLNSPRFLLRVRAASWNEGLSGSSPDLCGPSGEIKDQIYFLKQKKNEVSFRCSNAEHHHPNIQSLIQNSCSFQLKTNTENSVKVLSPAAYLNDRNLDACWTYFGYTQFNYQVKTFVSMMPTVTSADSRVFLSLCLPYFFQGGILKKYIHKIFVCVNKCHMLSCYS